MQFAKLENGILKRCPKADMSGKSYHTNLPLYYEHNPDKAYADGWLELILTGKPEGSYASKYKVENKQLVQYWVELPVPEPEPDPIEERMNMIEECILEMSEIIYS